VSAPFGIVGVFATPDAIRAAAHRLREMGVHAVDAYTPYPIPGLHGPRGRRSLLPAVMFAAAVVGAAAGYFIQYWDEVLNYPINVGGRPFNSWPAFIVSTFEIMLLFAIAAGFFALLAACRLPALYHPLFAAADFSRVSSDRFVLCVEAGDPSFEPDTIRRVLERFGAEHVEMVAA
jgi:hypothetical protein